MKRIISLALAVIMVLYAGLSCAYADDESDETWSVACLDDNADRQYLTAVFTNEKKGIKVKVDWHCLELTDSTEALYFTIYDLEKDVPITDTNKGDSFVPCVFTIGEEVYVESLIRMALDENSNIYMLLGEEGHEIGENYPYVYSALIEGEEDISFAIDVNGEAYTFTINGKGFASTLEDLGQSVEDVSDPEEEKPDDPYDGIWDITYYVDDFGDPTDVAYLRNIYYGTFSNTATSGSDLTVVVQFDMLSDSKASIDFRLLEYNRTRATYLSSEDINLKIKMGDNIYEERLTGDAPNGDVYGIAEKGGTNACSRLFDRLLNGGEEAKCIIEIGSSKYNFTIDGNGFSACMKELYGEESSDEGSSESSDGYIPIEINGDCYNDTGIKTFDTIIADASLDSIVNNDTVIIYDCGEKAKEYRCEYINYIEEEFGYENISGRADWGLYEFDGMYFNILPAKSDDGIEETCIYFMDAAFVQ